MKKKQFYIVVLALFTLFSCNKAKQNNEKNLIITEDSITTNQVVVEEIIEEINTTEFDSFRQKFYTDSLFQINHIVFPLRGIDSNKMEMNDTIYTWQEKKDWEYIRDPNEYEDIITTVITKNDSIIVELSHLEYGGFWHLVRFERINENWFLTRFEFVF